MCGQTGTVVHKISYPFYWLMWYKLELSCRQAQQDSLYLYCVPPFYSSYSHKNVFYAVQANFWPNLCLHYYHPKLSLMWCQIIRRQIVLIMLLFSVFYDFLLWGFPDPVRDCPSQSELISRGSEWLAWWHAFDKWTNQSWVHAPIFRPLSGSYSPRCTLPLP